MKRRLAALNVAPRGLSGVIAIAVSSGPMNAFPVTTWAKRPTWSSPVGARSVSRWPAGRAGVVAFNGADAAAIPRDDFLEWGATPAEYFETLRVLLSVRSASIGREGLSLVQPDHARHNRRSHRPRSPKQFHGPARLPAARRGGDNRADCRRRKGSLRTQRRAVASSGPNPQNREERPNCGDIAPDRALSDDG